MGQRSIELRVGGLLLGAMLLLLAFVVVMGGLSLKPTTTLLVDFENPGGLGEGAPVRISGVRAGRVAEILFRGEDPAGELADAGPLIRVVVEIEEPYRNAVREDARFYVTSQGMLGEMFLAIEPGSASRPVLSPGAVVRGVGPPRLDLLLSEGYELLHRVYLGVSRHEDEIRQTFDGLRRTLVHTARFMEQNEPKLARAVDNLEALTRNANLAVAAARERYVDGPQPTRIMNHLERGAVVFSEDLGPLLEESRAAAAGARRLTEALGSDTALSRYRAIAASLERAASQTEHASEEARALIRHVRRGEGTLGALVMDEAVYDDVQEMLRDLKHNPWKFFWRQ
jgi:phospholipid/cholesterol/gamma-HCH transport system substrate-binding protein